MKHKYMEKYYQKIIKDEHTETWSFVPTTEDDYPKYIIEGEINGLEDDAYVVFYNTFTEQEVIDMEATEISQEDFEGYYKRIGSHPPQKPK